VTALPPLPPLLYEPLLRRELTEDLGRAGDLTTDAIFPAGATGEAFVVARAAGRIAGLPAALRAFTLLDPRCEVEPLHEDGRDAEAGQRLAVVRGPARAILSAERTALNLLGHLSGVATATRRLVRLVEEVRPGGATRVVDTRKTTPGLRSLQKYAVRCGGGANHRFGLDDAVLIKDNHLALAGGIEEAVKRARAYAGHTVKIEIEVDTLEQLDQALAVGVDIVLLDNMAPEMLREAVQRCAGHSDREGDGQRVLTEASGGIDADTIQAVARTGVDLIAVGAITHSAPSLDVALDVEVRAGCSDTSPEETPGRGSGARWR
jgi:nicotinate-nucleotide pyrophosphorylase (carboxylating)